MTATSHAPLLDLETARRIGAEVGIPEAMAELNVFRVLLHRPALAKQYNDLLLGLIFGGELDDHLRELVIMRLGWETRSVYEWTQHWKVALDLGMSEATLLAVRDWRTSDRFGPAERAVLAATDETLATGAVSEQTLRACQEHVSDDPAVLVELVTAIGWWRLISTVLQSFDVPLEEGVAPWPPDGVGPADR